MKSESLQGLLEQINPSVRAQKAYLVGLDEHISTKLNQNENPYDVPHDLKVKLLEQLLEVPWNRYPNDQPLPLQQALATYLNFDISGILIGNGSNELSMTLGLAFIANGKTVVLPSPMFSLYKKTVQLFGGNLISVPAKSDLCFDVEAIKEAIRTHSPSLTVIGSPNNPTGTLISKTELLEIVSISKGFVLVDEAYIEFVGDGKGLQDEIDAHPNLILLRTFSKAFGLAGVRIGYLLGQSVIIQELLKARIPFMVNQFSEAIGIALLQQKDIFRERIEIIKLETQKLYQALCQMEEITVFPTQTNFMLFKTPFAPKDLLNKLSQEGILIRDMSGYASLQGFTRVSVGTPKENLLFLESLKKVLKMG